MRVLILTEENRAISETPISGDFDSSTVMSPLTHVSHKTSLLQLSPPRTYSHSDPESTVDDLEATYMSMNQISESLEAIVHGTKYAVMSPDRLLHRRIAHVYQDLSKAGIQIQQLKSSIGQFKELRKSVKAAASSGNVRTSYNVYVDSKACIESKVVFASGKKQGTNAFLDYLAEIKHFISLRRCANVSEFRGVVLDDSRRHLRGYLKELPMFTSLDHLLGLANSRSKTIPLLIRELWARQLVQAVVEIHSQGLILGAFGPYSMAIRADGTVIFHKFQRSKKYIEDQDGLSPPELRHLYRDSYSDLAIRDELNSHTDIFQLGLVLWQLTEHVPQNSGHFCAKYACTHWPRRTCMATHANPVELPACNDDTPAYLCEIIRGCRLPNPQSRISASELAYILSTTAQPDVTPADIQEALTPYIELCIDSGLIIRCDECGETTTGMHFHCNICRNNDYDICQACFEKGCHCLVPEHRLIRRARGKNEFL